MSKEIQLYKKVQEIVGKTEDPLLQDFLGSIKQTEELKQNASSNRDLYAIFAFDTTGSMSSCINEVRTNLTTIVDNLVKKYGINIMVAGVGEYCDEPHTLQIKDFTNNPQELRKNIESINNTGGGDACQVSLELLWQELNKKYIKEENKYVMVVISDQIAHGQDRKEPNPRADYQKELSRLRPFLSGFYFISCTASEETIRLQKELVGEESRTNKHIYLKDMIDILPELLVYILMETQSHKDAENFLFKQVYQFDKLKALKIHDVLRLEAPKND